MYLGVLKRVEDGFCVILDPRLITQYIRWFKKVLVVILCYLSNIKLQTARISTV